MLTDVIYVSRWNCKVVTLSVTALNSFQVIICQKYGNLTSKTPFNALCQLMNCLCWPSILLEAKHWKVPNPKTEFFAQSVLASTSSICTEIQISPDRHNLHSLFILCIFVKLQENSQEAEFKISFLHF